VVVVRPCTGKRARKNGSVANERPHRQIDLPVSIQGPSTFFYIPLIFKDNGTLMDGMAPGGRIVSAARSAR
jgi:hypothetical protein